MQQMYEPPKFDESQPPEAAELSNATDYTEKFLKLVGFGLLLAFIFPIYVAGKMLFINFQLMGTTRIAGSLKFQMLYPLIAGVIVLVLARKERTQGKGWGLIAIGVFPVLLLLMSSDVQRAFSNVSQGMPGAGSLGIRVILSNLAIFGMLSGAYASYVRPGLGNYAKVAVAGGGLYLLTLLIPQNGQIPLFIPFKLMFSKSIPGTGGIMFVTGLVTLAVMVVESLAALNCLLMRNPHRDPRLPAHTDEGMRRSFQVKKSGTIVDHGQLGEMALKLWFSQFIIFGVFLLYVMIATPGAGMMGGSIFMMMTMGLIKFVPWFLGLYLLIPMGIAEIMLAGNEPPKRRIVV